MMKQRKSVYYLMTAFVMFLITGDIHASDKEDVLKIIFWQAPTTLNPHMNQGLKDWEAGRITYEPLASFDAKGNLIPILASEIPSIENGGVAKDGKSVTWKLKPDVRWSDGEPFTADDVCFTYEFITNPRTRSTMAFHFEIVKSVEKVDNLTVRINFRDVNPAWTEHFIGVESTILPRHIFRDYNNEKARDAPANMSPVGTGPYRMLSYDAEDIIMIGDDLIKTVRINYEANPFYREKGKPYFRRLEVYGGGDAITAAKAVLSLGSADFAWHVMVESEELEKMKPFATGRMDLEYSPFVERIVLNFTDPNQVTDTGERSSLRFPHPFFSDKKVRRAFAHAVDRSAIALLFGQAGSPSTNLLASPEIYDSPHTADMYPFDLKKASRLLDEAGWTDTDKDGIREKQGVKMKVLMQTSANSRRRKTLKIIQNALQSIRVGAEIKLIDASVFFHADGSNPNSAGCFYADMEEYADYNSVPDPGAYMRYWTCEQAAQQSNNWHGKNVARWCDPEYDKSHRQSVIETNPEKRKELFVRMNDMIIEDVAMIPLVRRTNQNAVSNTLEGVEITSWDGIAWKIQNWKRKPPEKK